jgi:hypothetical protein
MTSKEIVKNTKKTILKMFKTKKQIEEGERTCRLIKAVSDIRDSKFPASKKIQVLNAYGLGLKNEMDLLSKVPNWLETKQKSCIAFLSSIGVEGKENVKEYMKILTNDITKKTNTRVSVSNSIRPSIRRASTLYSRDE